MVPDSVVIRPAVTCSLKQLGVVTRRQVIHGALC